MIIYNIDYMDHRMNHLQWNEPSSLFEVHNVHLSSLQLFSRHNNDFHATLSRCSHLGRYWRWHDHLLGL